MVVMKKQHNRRFQGRHDHSFSLNLAHCLGDRRAQAELVREEFPYRKEACERPK